MNGLENYPMLQFIISILLIIVAVLLMIISFVIRKKFKLDLIFSITTFSMGVFMLVFSVSNFMLKAIFALNLNG